MPDGAILPTTNSTSPGPPEWERTYPGQKDQIGKVRADMRGLLGDCPVADDVVLLLSELGTNAISHSKSGTAGGKFIVRVSDFVGDYVYGEVEDEGSDWLGDLVLSARRPHGLYVVRQLATACGVDRGKRTRIVWFTIDYSPGGAQPIAANAPRARPDDQCCPSSPSTAMSRPAPAMTSTAPPPDIGHRRAGWRQPGPQPDVELPPWEVTARYLPVPLETSAGSRQALERNWPRYQRMTTAAGMPHHGRRGEGGNSHDV